MKFIADSCSNFNFPAVEGDVSISTATYRGRLLFSSVVNESICCGTLSSEIRKSLAASPEIRLPFLSVTVIGSRTRRTLMISGFSWLCSEVVAGGTRFCGLGCCAAADTSNKDKTKQLIKTKYEDCLIDCKPAIMFVVAARNSMPSPGAAVALPTD